MRQAGLFSGFRSPDIIGDDWFFQCNGAGNFNKFFWISNRFDIEVDDLRMRARCKVFETFHKIDVRFIADTDGSAETHPGP